MSIPLSSFNAKAGRHYWQVKDPSAPINGLPCFTKPEMRCFERMTAGEIKWCLDARLSGTDICWDVPPKYSEEEPDANIKRAVADKYMEGIRAMLAPKTEEMQIDLTF